MASPFDKTKAVNGTSKSSATPTKDSGGKSRGVEHPISTDMALIGDTRHELHTKSLPKSYGPNYGLGKTGLGQSDQLRVDCGEGMSGEA